MDRAQVKIPLMTEVSFGFPPFFFIAIIEKPLSSVIPPFPPKWIALLHAGG